MSDTDNINIPIQFDQLVDLINSLSKKRKEQLLNLLQQKEPESIPEWQKQEVRKRIKKYENHPELLIHEKQASELIKKM